MNIKSIKLHNFQAIKDFEGNFEGGVYLVTGENEIGKSTLLKSIMVMLTGDRDEVLRVGSDKGYAQMVVGQDGEEYEVKLSFTKANPRGVLTITSKATGMKSDKISTLQSIFGYQDFDAQEFVSWSETAEGRCKQVEVIKGLLPAELRADLEQLANEVAACKEKRKKANDDVRYLKPIYDKARQEVADIPEADLPKYAQMRDVAELMQEQQLYIKMTAREKQVREKLALRESVIAGMPARMAEVKETAEENCRKAELQAKQRIDDNNARVERMARELEELRATMAKANESIATECAAVKKDIMASCATSQEALENELKDAQTRKANSLEWLKNFEANKPQDRTADIENLAAFNEKCAKVAEVTRAQEALKEANANADKFNAEIAELTARREEKIRTANLPVAGLDFAEDGLTLNGIPFVAGKVSDSQIMQVAAQLVIAANKKVKVFRIARGESLGKKKLDALIDMAVKMGYQGFIEQVVREQDDLRVVRYED